MNQELEPNRNYSFNNYPIAENSENGLNIIELKNILVRKLPLIVGFTLCATLLGLFKILTSPAIYKAQFELLSEPVNIETQVTSTNEDSRKTREVITDVDLDEVQLKILKSHKLILRIVDKLKDKYPDLSYGNLIADLNVEIISNSKEDQNILKVTYKNPDKQRVIDVLDTLTKVYQGYSVEKRQSGIKRGVAFLNRQIPKVSEEAKNVEQQIAKLRTQYNFNNPNTALERITSRINQLALRREEIANKLQEFNLTLSNFDQELITQPANLTSATNFATPKYLDLQTRLRKIDVEISQKSAIFYNQSEILQASIKEKEQLIQLITEAGKDIRRKLVAQISILENRDQSLEKEANNLKIQLGQWSEISGEYNSLQNRLNIANNKLNQFNSKKDALEIDAAQQESPWQLLTPAGEPTTSDVSAINYLILSSTLGFCLGAGLAVLLDKQENIIYSSVKVEEITNLPILAAVPYSPQSKQFPFLKLTNSKSSTKQRRLPYHDTLIEEQKELAWEFSNTSSIEPFRSFAVNLGLVGFDRDSKVLNLDTHPKSIAITSAIPGEGKSTVALNLAKASASMGNRVLIVDTDLRSSRKLTNIFGLESIVGLKNILKPNTSSSALDYIQELPFEENLFFLPSGLSIWNQELMEEDFGPLLASSKMHDLMEELKKQFDLVIYDLCSIIGFADVNLLSSRTDGIVVVTAMGKIQTTAFTEALNQLKMCKAPVLGIAANKLVK